MASDAAPMGSAAEADPEASAVEAVEKFLFTDFPTRETFTTKDYEKDATQTTTEAIQKRFEGYQKICFYRLGSAFMGAATGVLDNMQSTHPEWAHWGSLRFAFSLVLMLNGLSAASFPSSTYLALGTAGLGAWTSYVHILATFHVASLKYHSHLKECVSSMICSTVAATFFWGYSSQDPLVFLILSKLAVWLVVFVLYCICWLIKLVLCIIGQVISLVYGLCGLVSTLENPWREPLLGRNRSNMNAKRDDYESSTVV